MTADPPPLEVRAGARLHFGLLDTVAPFGGTGLMIDRPATRITLHPADRFSVGIPSTVDPNDQAGLEQRVTDVVERFVRLRGVTPFPALQIDVVERPPAHSGLGTGTQLAMAVAAGLNRWFQAGLSSHTIMHHVAARGERSGVGSFGFFSGGLVVDSDPPRSLAVPDSWRVVLLQPRQAPATVSGLDENQRFANLQRSEPQQREALQACLSEQLEPLARAGAFAPFAAAVREYNWLSGNLFASAQGGAYNGPEITRLIEQVQQRGYQGVGQSSWGPTVFALCEDDEQAQRLVSDAPSAAATAVIAAPLNRPATIG